MRTRVPQKFYVTKNFLTLAKCDVVCQSRDNVKNHKQVREHKNILLSGRKNMPEPTTRNLRQRPPQRTRLSTGKFCFPWLTILLSAITTVTDIKRAHAANTSLNPNISGYVGSTTKGSFTYSSGSFVVPNLEGAPDPFILDIWVGIGSPVGNIWQAGVEICSGTAALPCEQTQTTGSVFYRTWYENFNDSSPTNSLLVYQSPNASNVSPGDTITITVSQQKNPKKYMERYYNRQWQNTRMPLREYRDQASILA